MIRVESSRSEEEEMMDRERLTKYRKQMGYGEAQVLLFDAGFTDDQADAIIAVGNAIRADTPGEGPGPDWREVNALMEYAYEHDDGSFEFEHNEGHPPTYGIGDVRYGRVVAAIHMRPAELDIPTPDAVVAALRRDRDELMTCLIRVREAVSDAGINEVISGFNDDRAVEAMDA